MALYADIEKKLGAFQLKVKLEIQNDTLAVVGASGAGKSITLKCIAGIVKPDKGRIVLDGQVLFDSELKIHIPTKDRNIGYLFQNYALFPHMTVVQNIMYGMQGTKDVNLKRAEDFMNRYYLQGCAQLYPDQLSGGQQQRTALARMLAAAPRLLLFDEPLSALDPYLRWQMEQELAKTIEEFGGSALIVSHNMEEVYRLCDYGLIMNEGRAEAFGTKKLLFQKPETLTAAMLTGIKNISRAKKLNGNTVRALDWGITLRVTEQVRDEINYVGIHSHQIQLTNGMEDYNVAECLPPMILDDLESKVMVFRSKDLSGATDWSDIRYELSEENYRQIRSKDCVFLKIPENKVIQMR